MEKGNQLVGKANEGKEWSTHTVLGTQPTDSLGGATDSPYSMF